MKIYETVAELALAIITTGQLVQTKGETVFNDQGGATYLVEAADPGGAVALAGGNFAVAQPGGGGATGGGEDKIFYENGQNVTVDYTITAGTNAMSAGPVTIDGGVTVTVPVGSEWTIVGDV